MIWASRSGQLSEPVQCLDLAVCRPLLRAEWRRAVPVLASRLAGRNVGGHRLGNLRKRDRTGSPPSRWRPASGWGSAKPSGLPSASRSPGPGTDQPAPGDRTDPDHPLRLIRTSLSPAAVDRPRPRGTPAHLPLAGRTGHGPDPGRPCHGLAFRCMPPRSPPKQKTASML